MAVDYGKWGSPPKGIDPPIEDQFPLLPGGAITPGDAYGDPLPQVPGQCPEGQYWTGTECAPQMTKQPVEDCYNTKSPFYWKQSCIDARAGNGTPQPPGWEPPDKGWEPPPSGDMGPDTPTSWGAPPNSNNSGGLPGNANLNDPLPPYQTALPDVSPYDVSSSRDWMNIFDYGGENANVNAINPQAQEFDYAQVGDFSDAAWQNSMRYLEPQMELQDDRFAQELINKGIDPNSEAGQKAFRQKQMGQNDLLSKSAFDALGYGSGLQQQMFGQDATRSQLASAMLQSQMGLSQRGHEFDIASGLQANDMAYNQMMGLEGLNYRDYLSNVDQSRYQDSLALALAGLAPAPAYQTYNAGLPQAPVYEYNAEQNYFNNLGF